MAQVAVSAMDFDDIYSGFDSSNGGASKSLNDHFDLNRCELFRRSMIGIPSNS